MLEAFDGQQQVKTRRGAVCVERTEAYAAARGGAFEEPRVSRTSAEQSNTSIVYGDRLILKLFRRIQPGVNPDFEIGRYLTEVVKFDRVPPVTGAIQYEKPAGPASTIGQLQRLVESQADGWEHATDELSRFYDQVAATTPPRLSPPTSSTELAETTPPKRVHDIMRPYLATAETLGRRTAELHVALASDSRDPAFAPEPFTKEDMRIVTANTVAEAIKAVRSLEEKLAQSPASANALPPDVAERASELLLARERLLGELREGPPFEFAISKIRIHGDYHLGQVLWAEGDFYILDFEGEPARPLEQRREKQLPLKDVAGMLRSFSYAAYAALFAFTSARPAEFARLEPWARIWQVWVIGAFLRGYLHKSDKAMFLPAEPAQRDALLRYFMLDKALYELNYELNNRPDWVRIPIWGILEIMNVE
jgi:maltose alpha-D-glucosyltransferase/alpha-amylase